MSADSASDAGASAFRVTAGCGLLACSPRQGGNSDTAARLFARGYAAGHGSAPEPVFLRDYEVFPCKGCDACRRALHEAPSDFRTVSSRLNSLFGQEPGGFPAFGCPQAARDAAAPLLRFLAEAPALCLVSPVYFYHLPAAFKALIDRTQPFWHLRAAGIDPFLGRERRCHVILIGAREKGKRLFEGSLLTLRYALAGLHVRLAEPLLLHGLDKPGALERDGRARELVWQYGERAGGG